LLVFVYCSSQEQNPAAYPGHLSSRPSTPLGPFCGQPLPCPPAAAAGAPAETTAAAASPALAAAGASVGTRKANGAGKGTRKANTVEAGAQAAPAPEAAAGDAAVVAVEPPAKKAKLGKGSGSAGIKAVVQEQPAVEKAKISRPGFGGRTDEWLECRCCATPNDAFMRSGSFCKFCWNEMDRRSKRKIMYMEDPVTRAVTPEQAAFRAEIMAASRAKRALSEAGSSDVKLAKLISSYTGAEICRRVGLVSASA